LAEGVAAQEDPAAQPDDARHRDLPADAVRGTGRPLAGLGLALLVGLVAFALGAFLFGRLRDTLPEEV